MSFEGAPGLVERPKKRFRFDGQPAPLSRSPNDKALSGDTLIEFRNQPVCLRKMIAFLEVFLVPRLVGEDIIHMQRFLCCVVNRT